jgi:putative ATPase
VTPPRTPPPGDDLFAAAVEGRLSQTRPLAARMRPETLDEVVGQAALLGPGGALREAIAGDRVPSMILYGPPGSGKTTLARVVAGATSAAFEELSAVSATVADVRAGMTRARDRLAAGTRTVLFLDEIHRFNRAQQDALLPAVEDGLLTLIGATTQNPWYEVNAALVSRMRVWVLEPLGPEEIGRVVDRALADPRRLTGRVRLGEEGRAAIVARAGGDARGALNLLEAAAAGTADGDEVALETVQSAAGGRAVVYDRAGDAHYDTISAFIKSLRASDPDAAIYYLAVMLSGGEDPKFIARRLIVAASEDVGNADPRALEVAVAAGRAVEFVGLPEARISLAQATTYIALAPKSNASYKAIGAALERVEREGAQRPPIALRDSSRANARNLGHGTGYTYPHDHPDAVLDESLLPEELEGVTFYHPTDRGPEGELAERLRRLRARLADEEQPF